MVANIIGMMAGIAVAVLAVAWVETKHPNWRKRGVRK
jgi:hypothetical protein